MGEGRELTLHPIGWVAKGRPRGEQDVRWEIEASELEIAPAWAGALDGIEDFTHIWVVWWLDRFETPPDALRVRPERKEELPLVGIFATRSPHRPNPIALTAVRLLERRGATLLVEGLDAYEGTHILDIKPYLRRGDMIPEAQMPDWLERLWRIQNEEREG